MNNYILEVQRHNLSETRIMPLVAPEELDLAADEALLSIDKFALTANNISYGVAGDKFGYWRFFPTEDPWGRIPAWGIGTVVRSNKDGLKPGDRFYGYFPMASYLAVKPFSVSDRGFSDGAEHRAPLSPLYSRYLRMTPENGFDPKFEDHQMIYRPLFLTSFILDDFLDDCDFSGADTVILSSASSKTSIGLAFLLQKRERVKVVGLTSESNKGFVKSLGIYDEIVGYGDIESMQANRKVAFIDMAGNHSVVGRLHRHFQDNMLMSYGVGRTHWTTEVEKGLADLPGARFKGFFAPSHIEKRNQEWGPQKFQQEFIRAWTSFVEVVDNWLTIRHESGEDGLLATFQIISSGASPDTAFVVNP